MYICMFQIEDTSNQLYYTSTKYIYRQLIWILMYIYIVVSNWYVHQFSFILVLSIHAHAYVHVNIDIFWSCA